MQLILAFISENKKEPDTFLFPVDKGMTGRCISLTKVPCRFELSLLFHISLQGRASSFHQSEDTSRSRFLQFKMSIDECSNALT